MIASGQVILLLFLPIQLMDQGQNRKTPIPAEGFRPESNVLALALLMVTIFDYPQVLHEIRAMKEAENTNNGFDKPIHPIELAKAVQILSRLQLTKETVHMGLLLAFSSDQPGQPLGFKESWLRFLATLNLPFHESCDIVRILGVQGAFPLLTRKVTCRPGLEVNPLRFGPRLDRLAKSLLDRMFTPAEQLQKPSPSPCGSPPYEVTQEDWEMGPEATTNPADDQDLAMSHPPQ